MQFALLWQLPFVVFVASRKELPRALLLICLFIFGRNVKTDQFLSDILDQLWSRMLTLYFTELLPLSYMGTKARPADNAVTNIFRPQRDSWFAIRAKLYTRFFPDPVKVHDEGPPISIFRLYLAIYAEHSSWGIGLFIEHICWNNLLLDDTRVDCFIYLGNLTINWLWLDCSLLLVEFSNPKPKGTAEVVNAKHLGFLLRYHPSNWCKFTFIFQ